MIILPRIYTGDNLAGEALALGGVADERLLGGEGGPADRLGEGGPADRLGEGRPADRLGEMDWLGEAGPVEPLGEGGPADRLGEAVDRPDEGAGEERGLDGQRNLVVRLFNITAMSNYKDSDQTFHSN